mgnify:CR=1 FL=1
MSKRAVPANILRRALAVVLAGAMTVSLFGCNAETKEQKEQREFNEYCDELFKDMLGDDVLSVHYKLADPEKMGIEVKDYTLGDFTIEQIEEGETKELPIIVKADVQGSVEAVKQSLEKLSNAEVRVKVIHGAVGAVSKSDVMLAQACGAIIVGFNVRPDPVARDMAESEGVDMRMYRVIYDAIEEISSAMKGMLAPKTREVELGRAEVREVFKITGVGTVAGCYVLEGKITRNAEIRIVRDGIIIADEHLTSLKRFKDDVKEVAKGYECGMGIEKFNDLKVGDIFEAYTIEEYRD